MLDQPRRGAARGKQCSIWYRRYDSAFRGRSDAGMAAKRRLAVFLRYHDRICSSSLSISLARAHLTISPSNALRANVGTPREKPRRLFHTGSLRSDDAEISKVSGVGR